QAKQDHAGQRAIRFLAAQLVDGTARKGLQFQSVRDETFYQTLPLQGSAIQKEQHARRSLADPSYLPLVLLREITNDRSIVFPGFLPPRSRMHSANSPSWTIKLW